MPDQNGFARHSDFDIDCNRFYNLVTSRSRKRAPQASFRAARIIRENAMTPNIE
jgi:hypothetical protein